MGRPLNLVGQRFGLLTVVSYVGLNKHQNKLWECQCDCGGKTVTTSHCLTSGQTKSCGCLKKQVVTERINQFNYKHGETKTRLYNIWCGMKARCKYPSHISYKNYGGRGVSVCQEWEHSFKSFEIWALSHGYDPEAPRGQCTLDRIDVDGDYEPSNCRWITQREQMRNTRLSKARGANNG